MRSPKFYNWEPRNSLSILALNPEPFTKSFETAFSSYRIEDKFTASESINMT